MQISGLRDMELGIISLQKLLEGKNVYENASEERELEKKREKKRTSRGKVEIEESLETCQGTAGEDHYLKADISWLVWHKGVKRDH